LSAATGGNSPLSESKILLGVSGGIAAYKAVFLAREICKRGAEVRVVMTENATRFVAPLTFATLTRQPVCTSLWTEPDSRSARHIANAQWGDLLCIAPATANIVAKLANGIADDALSTLYLAWNGPVVIAPAMNVAMYRHPAYEANEAVLRERGAVIVGPDEGELACGEEGSGRLAEIATIVAAIEDALGRSSLLEGLAVLVTAGPTREHLDPMRFLSNPSSGKMGFALAEQAARMGAKVSLVAGPVALPTPRGVERVDVVSADEMLEAVAERGGDADILVFAAAVADFAPEKTTKRKIKKNDASRRLETIRLRRTPDVARTFGERKRPDQVSVGFSADTEDFIESARRKMREKNFDLVVVNPIERADPVFGSDENRGWLIGQNGETQSLEKMSKKEMAGLILEKAAVVLRRKRGV